MMMFLIGFILLAPGESSLKSRTNIPFDEAPLHVDGRLQTKRGSAVLFP
jgi:hypothetical protein